MVVNWLGHCTGCPHHGEGQDLQWMYEQEANLCWVKLLRMVSCDYCSLVIAAVDKEKAWVTPAHPEKFLGCVALAVSS